jgi:hypothetical protein
MPPVQSRAPGKRSLSPEEGFVLRFLMLLGFTLGLWCGALSDWPWWYYLALPVIWLLAIVGRAIYDLYREARCA